MLNKINGSEVYIASLKAIEKLLDKKATFKLTCFFCATYIFSANMTRG